MKRICIPLEIKPKVSDDRLRKAFKSVENLNALIEELIALREPEIRNPCLYPRFYYLR